MSKNSASKAIGKIVSLIILILLLGVIAVTWFIGGQTKAIEKYCAAFASGDLKSMNKVTDIYSDQTDDKSFKQQQKDHFRSLPQFEELEDTDVISSDVDVKYHKKAADFTQWECMTKADYFSQGMSISQDITFTLKFEGGKWKIISAE